MRKRIPRMSDMDSVTTCTPGPPRYAGPIPWGGENEIIYNRGRIRGGQTAEFVLARTIPPGCTIRRELDARGWDQRYLAEIMRCTVDLVSGLADGTEEITPETARLLASAFGTSVEFWVNLEANYRQHISGQIC